MGNHYDIVTKSAGWAENTPTDEKLPSVRSLATQLSINPNTIQRAYNELEGEGYIYSVPGKGSFATGETGAGGFPRAVGAHKAIDASRGDGQAHAVQGGEAVKALDGVGNLNHRVSFHGAV